MQRGAGALPPLLLLSSLGLGPRLAVDPKLVVAAQ